MHGMPRGSQRPADHRVRVNAQDLARGRVRLDDQPVGSTVNDTLRQGLEQRTVPVLRHGQLLGQRLLAEPVPDMRGDVGREHQYPGNGAVGAGYRLIDEVDKHLLGPVTATADP